MDRVNNMMMKHLLLASACSLYITQAVGQENTTPQEEALELDEIVVVGSQIKGAKVTGGLPVTLLGESDMDAIAASSASELFGSLPSNGVMNFNGTDTVGGGVNSARGDVASINLRGIGSGNTLILLNGRRVVQHPGTQSENLVPVTTANLNAIPVSGIRRIEVLHDGASAIYGTDAVAGVINTVLRDNYEGYRVNAQYGGSEDIDRRKLKVDFLGGWRLNDDKTHVSLSMNYYNGTGVDASERPYSASSDRRPLVDGTDFEGDTQFRSLSTDTPWGQFEAGQRVRQNGDSLTTRGGRFHIQPQTSSGCRADINADICIDDSSLNSDLRFDSNTDRQMIPDVKRGNAFLFVNHEFDSGMEFYSELSYYRAESKKYREASGVLSSAPITISKNAYWNPFGAVGNVNRLAGIDAPDEGLDITTTGYRAVDAGRRQIDVDNDSFRLLGGLRGELGEWSWDSAALYSEATTLDTTHNRISNTLFEAAINRTDDTAYNPFNGGDIANVSAGDTTGNPQDTIDSFLIDVTRKNKTTLGMVDFKVSNPAAFELFGNEVGAAVGVEWRRTSFAEDRDDRLDGTINFTRADTGDLTSDVMNSSPTPDSSGSRNVISAFAELAVPLLAHDESRKFAHSLDLQLAGRFEHYNDVGSVFKPKVALSWVPLSGIQLRAAYSEGFRAPNLEQLHTEKVTRVNTRTDWYRCQAAVNKGTADDLGDCGDYSDSVESIRSGSKDLIPEESKNYSVGMVLTPESAIGLTFTVDYWRIEQKDLVGIFGDANQIALDFVRRMGGSTNDAVIRSAATQDDIDFFAGSGLEAAGNIANVLDPYLNLDSRVTEGIDLGLYFSVDDTTIGDFDFKLNGSRLLTAFQDLSESATEINNFAAAEIRVAGAGDLIEQNSRPKWQASGTITWRNGNWGAGIWGKYTGKVFETGVTQNDTDEFFIIEDWFRMNTYVQYTFDKGAMDNTRIRLGVRNVFDKAPPLADNTFGYLSSLHSSEGRFFYASVRKSF
ncbi:TonB-dependent receptor domain-containing protein [Paremcibacter congregatus]|uniref:TonB-dependent receptor n=1 Tax=Paremcibacter congregatus TaxID=2043170 RepID=A0A2G4YQJ1_9PROT|nr:TonB-dependent receptor [Paremcibacter congregatus]PHZ84585.1 TonB-dependent receptor [Paremcibacter congregatus]QDE28805.1 TonB-dependent receptor [Paremcibacter congregatus]